MSSNSGSTSHRALRQMVLRALDLTLWALQVLAALVFLIFGATSLILRAHFGAHCLARRGARTGSRCSAKSASVNGSDISRVAWKLFVRSCY